MRGRYDGWVPGDEADEIDEDEDCSSEELEVHFDRMENAEDRDNGKY